MEKRKNKQITVGGTPGVAGQGSSTIVLSAPRIGGVDISTYMQAVRDADRIDYPQRVRLYNLYIDLLTSDAHLVSVIGKRRSALLEQPIVFRRRDRVDDRIQELVRGPWFHDFVGDIFDARLWGFSLFQVRRDGGSLAADLIPRKHVDPVRRLILPREGSIAGPSWDDYDGVLFVGKSRDIGLLAQAAPYAIYKRNGLAAFAEYAELFGQPIREGTYATYDDEARRAMLRDLLALGSAPVVLHPEGTTIKLHEAGQKAGSAELFGRLLTYCDEAMSKLLLGNTLTTQASDTGTQALGTVHKSVEEKIHEDDRQYVLRVLNYQFVNLLEHFGFPTRGGEFAFEAPQVVDLSQRIEIDSRLKAMGLPIDDEYFYQTYGIDRPKEYEKMKKEARAAQSAARHRVEEPDDTANTNSATATALRPANPEKGIMRRLRDFFGLAPDGDAGALDW